MIMTGRIIWWTDSNYEKNYLEGKYGGIPDLQFIVEECIE